MKKVILLIALLWGGALCAQNPFVKEKTSKEESKGSPTPTNPIFLINSKRFISA